MQSQRKLEWTDQSMLYHVVFKVLFLFIIYWFIYMLMIYNRI
jgi:hypothetical protein